MISKRVQFLSLMIFFCLASLFLSPKLVLADLTIGDYSLVGKVRVGRTVYEYTYNASVTNNGVNTVGVVVADLESLSPNINVIEGRLTFGEVTSGETVESDDTFTIRVNRMFSFNEADLQWTIVPLVGSYVIQPGTVKLPPNVPLNQCKIQAGLFDSTVASSGSFDVRVNTNTTTLLQLVNKDGDVICLNILPRDEILVESDSVLDVQSTAAAMVYLQSGIAVSDPIITAIQLALIKRLPEVQNLASLIEDSIRFNVPPVTTPSGEILNAAQVAMDAYLNYLKSQGYLISNSKLNRMFFAATSFLFGVQNVFADDADIPSPAFDNCDTLGTVLSHIQPTEDNLCVNTTKVSVAQLGGSVTTINNSCRWVFHFIDDWDGVHQVINDKYGVDGVSYPKRWVLPAVHKLCVDLFEESILSFQDIWGVLFKHENGHAIERAKERIHEWEKPAKSIFNISVPEEGLYTFSSYSIGKGLMEFPPQETDFKRAVFPYLLSCATELVLPVLEIGLGENILDHFEITDTEKLIEILGQSESLNDFLGMISPHNSS